MSLHYFSIPALHLDPEQEHLTQFLSRHSVVAVEQHLVWLVGRMSHKRNPPNACSK